ncbi:MAG: hypothetical protein HKN20_05300 [Gemmatimonadetes bacterium]|nr:hypothetical protein [Gemmatimonadota bacterium]
MLDGEREIEAIQSEIWNLLAARRWIPEGGASNRDDKGQIELNLPRRDAEPGLPFEESS